MSEYRCPFCLQEDCYGAQDAGVSCGEFPRDFDDEWERAYDEMLERQEMEDFAQDGYFENMEAWEIL